MLKDDKYSLAQCMRVSSIFNSMTAPILYSTIIMGWDTETPYITDVESQLSHRITPDTATNLNFIKHVFLNWHFPLSKATMSMYKDGRVFHVESLNLFAIVLDRVGCSCTDWNTPTAGHECLVIRMHQPKKLVVDGAHPNCANYDVSVFEHLESIVYLMGTRTPFPMERRPGSPFPCSSARVTSIIQVFGPNGRRRFGTLPRSITRKPQRQVMKPIDGYISGFALGIEWLVMHHVHIKDFVVVNGCDIHHLALDLAKHSTDEEKGAKLEVMVFDTLSKQVKFRATHRPGHIEIKYNNRNINVKFIGLETYLNTYDWSGEFTAEEVSDWLGDQEEE